MFVKNNFNTNNFDAELVEAIGNRLENNQFSDAILAGTKYLTTLLREKGQCEGMGLSLLVLFWVDNHLESKLIVFNLYQSRTNSADLKHY